MLDQYLNAFDANAVREMLARHRKLLIRVPLVALALGALVFLFAPRTYRSESRIFLRLGLDEIELGREKRRLGDDRSFPQAAPFD